MASQRSSISSLRLQPHKNPYEFYIQKNKTFILGN